MSYVLAGGTLLSRSTKLTTTSSTEVFPEGKRTTIVRVICSEINGGTPNLTLLKTDGTTTIYYRNALAMTARQTFILEGPIILQSGWSLKATSSQASGLVDVDVIYLAPDSSSK